MANCEKYEDCGREVFWDASGLCLAHEKERRAKEARAAQRAPKKTTARKTAAKKTAAKTGEGDGS